MELFDYSSLMRIVSDIQTNKRRAEEQIFEAKKKKLQKLEKALLKSGILKDWNELQYLCKNVGISLRPYGNDGEPKTGMLMEDDGFKSNGLYGTDIIDVLGQKEELGFWSFYSKVKWQERVYIEDDYIDKRIELINNFLKSYEEYRKVQLDRVYWKMSQITSETNKMLEEVV